MKRCGKMLAMVLAIVLVCSFAANAQTLDRAQPEQAKVLVNSPVSTIYFVMNSKWYSATTSFMISVGNPSSHAGIKSNTLASTVRKHQLSISFNTISYGIQSRNNSYTSTSKIGEFSTSTLCGCPYPLDSPGYTAYAGSCAYYYNGSALGTGIVQYY